MAIEEPPAKKAKTEDGEETEQDAPADSAPKIQQTATFYTEDTTMNVMASSSASTLMPLSDGGLQYLLAGARSNVGFTSGRYMFEVKIIEAMSSVEDNLARARVPQPRCHIRVGFSKAASSLFLGDVKEKDEGVCFDSEGLFTSQGRKATSGQKFGSGDIVAVLLNLDQDSPNANTVSLFKDGVRASKPQPLPDSLKGKILHPAIAFKNVTLSYNFGPSPWCPLPFVCKMVQDASKKDATVKAAIEQPRDGRFDVLFPVSIPDEGGFDWLDDFLQRNPQYAELSDRAILKWCESSGVQRTKGYAPASHASKDKPEMGFGTTGLDDFSVQRILHTVAPIQKRHYIVMELRENLIKEGRQELTAAWTAFRRVATVAIGAPPESIKAHTHDVILKQKQDAADIEFRTKQAQEKSRRAAERRRKQIELERRKAVKKQVKMQELAKKKAEFEKKKKEAEEKGEPAPEEEKVEEEPEEDEVLEEEEEPMDEEPPKVELSDEEKKVVFLPSSVRDLAPYLLNTSFHKFSLPEKSDGFDEIRYEWQSEAKAKQHFKEYVQNLKLTSRIEDLQPGDWFNTKVPEFTKTLQTWHNKQTESKNAETRKAAEKVAKEAAKKRAHEAAVAKAKKEGTEPPPAVEDAEDPSDTGKIDFENLDIFGVDDVTDIGGGEPLFGSFGLEDWALARLRFELHALTHAFQRDVNDPERLGIYIDHLGFYYQKYFKRPLNTLSYGCDTTQKLLKLVRDTVLLSPKKKVLEPLLPGDIESFNIFVMLTEDSRRDRMRMLDLGDESARLKIAASVGAPPMPTVVHRIPGQLTPGKLKVPMQAQVVPPKLGQQNKGNFPAMASLLPQPTYKGPQSNQSWR
eukprot:TRINITY_DN3491_c0_g2_i1.p1 TRINITY_DN3491_c0_g2~~TRINITY_DN3491_c0_g2_i1.p1  ORF type:complete len:856 (+),score=217.48 TRINITY_DN3491_c0_g2_i1:135-2702(+)